MDINQGRFLSIEKLQDQYLNNQKTSVSNKTDEGMSFSDILSKKSVESGEVKFSKHASSRLSFISELSRICHMENESFVDGCCILVI